METVLSVLTVVLLVLMFAQLVRSTRTKPAPQVDLDRTFLRRADYDADQKAIGRSLTDLNEALEARFKTLSGMISRSRRGAQVEERDELATAAADALARHRNSNGASQEEKQNSETERPRLLPLRSRVS